MDAYICTNCAYTHMYKTMHVHIYDVQAMHVCTSAQTMHVYTCTHTYVRMYKLCMRVNTYISDNKNFNLQAARVCGGWHTNTY